MLTYTSIKQLQNCCYSTFHNTNTTLSKKCTTILLCYPLCLYQKSRVWWILPKFPTWNSNLGDHSIALFRDRGCFFCFCFCFFWVQWNSALASYSLFFFMEGDNHQCFFCHLLWQGENRKKWNVFKRNWNIYTMLFWVSSILRHSYYWLIWWLIFTINEISHKFK